MLEYLGRDVAPLNENSGSAVLKDLLDSEERR